MILLLGAPLRPLGHAPISVRHHGHTTVIVVAHQSLANLSALELREMVTELMGQVGENAKKKVNP